MHIEIHLQSPAHKVTQSDEWAGEASQDRLAVSVLMVRDGAGCGLKNLIESKCEAALLPTDLSGCVWLLVAGQYLQHHAAARLLQHLLQHFGVIADLFAVHLLDNVAYMEQTLLIDHAAVEDPGYHQLAIFYSERHSLHTHLFQIQKLKQSWTVNISTCPSV